MHFDYALWMGLLLFVGAGVAYFAPTIIAVLRQVEGISVVLLLNVIPIAWPVALFAAIAFPRRLGPWATSSS